MNQTITQPAQAGPHLLEHDKHAQDYFDKIQQYPSHNATAAWRSAVRACTGSLPTWAQPKGPRGRTCALTGRRAA